MFSLVPSRGFFNRSLFDDLFELPSQVQSEEDKYTISLDVPGMTKEDLLIEVREGYIVASGSKEISGKTRSIRQCFSLPRDVELDTCIAGVENGILTITLNKKTSSSKRLIPIK